MAGKMGKYEVVYKVGNRALGVTFKVRNKMTGEQLAMKCIPRGYNIDQYVEREIMNHRVLQHPNVIKFKEVVLDGFKLGIVMEYGEKELLEEVLFKGPLAEAKARKMFQMIIAGVSYIHSKDICHRDLKLENIVLTNNGVLKICDFSLSKSIQLHSRAQTRVGTPPYWAPEVGLRVAGSTYDGKLADVYSCGVVLYMMLSKKNPDSQNENIASSCNKMSVTKECKNLILRMLDEIPEKRITIEEIKKHPWYLKDLPMDLTDEAQAVYCCDRNETVACQSEEEILKIIKQAKIIRVLETEKEDKTSASSQSDGEDGLEDTEETKNVGGQTSSTGKRKYEEYTG